MSIDDRDLLGDKHRVTSLEAHRFKRSDQQKRREAEKLKQRFANYSGASRSPLAVPKASWQRFLLIVLVLVIGAALLARW